MIGALCSGMFCSSINCHKGTCLSLAMVTISLAAANICRGAL